MTCGRCNTHFCWLCREKLNQEKPYDHFKDPFSGCFGIGVSCGGCYFGILAAQLIAFCCTPIILYFLMLYKVTKKWNFWKLCKPVLLILENDSADK
jgi:hypothetical protein